MSERLDPTEPGWYRTENGTEYWDGQRWGVGGMHLQPSEPFTRQADGESTGLKKPTNSAKKWWIAIGAIIVAGFVFQGPILDAVVQQDIIAQYGYCEDFNSCAEQSEKAMIEVRHRVGDALAMDCLVAHQEVAAKLSAGDQNYKAREGFCVVTGAVLNNKVGATYWTVPWNIKNDLLAPEIALP